MYDLISVEDVGDPSYPCDLCSTPLRYVHQIRSNHTHDEKRIGCECFRLYIEDTLMLQFPDDSDEPTRTRLTRQHTSLLQILESLVVSGLQFEFVVCHMSHYCLLQSTRWSRRQRPASLVGVWHRQCLGKAECGQVHHQHEVQVCTVS